MGQVPTLTAGTRHWRKRNGGPSLPKAGCSQRGPVGVGVGWGGGGPTTARQAPQEGPRPFLSVLPTALSSCACAKGKLQLTKTKTPKEELPRAALEDCWAATPFTGQPGPTARGWEAQRVTALLPLRGSWALLPQWKGGQTSWELVGVGASGSSCPHAPGLGSWASGGKSLRLAAPPLYSPSF